uniref:thiamine biosynthesis protein S n=1 Tax=Pulvinaster venetus TaxID=427767 RepID=UPI001FCDE6F9|nr:thiamine biosynthesis protein S [Pulvinaster venetus]UNJ16952.1 thiamine biosynthesis protein S [Pulvinaster venetus]
MNSNSKEEKILVKINGEIFACIANMSINELLQYLDFDINLIIVEYNSQIIPKNKLNATNVKHNDKLEIVTIVGGG